MQCKKYSEWWLRFQREERQRLLLEKQKAAQDRAKLEKEIKEREVCVISLFTNFAKRKLSASLRLEHC